MNKTAKKETKMNMKTTNIKQTLIQNLYKTTKKNEKL